MTSRFPRQSGFTLVELAVAVALSAIVAGFMAMFLSAPTQAYFSQATRAELTDSADSLVRNLDSDIRRALPRSVRQGAAGAVNALEMLEIADVARYYASGEPGGGATALQVGTATSSFTTVGPFNILGPGFSSASDYLVVNHLGTPANDAYRLTGVVTPVGTTITLANGPASGEVNVGLTPSFTFRGGDSQTHSVFVVSGPVVYLCDRTAQTIRRYSGYPISAAVPTSAAALTAAGAATALIAQHVSSCLFRPKLGGLLSNPDVVTIEVTLANGSPGTAADTFPVFFQAPLEYVP